MDGISYIVSVYQAMCLSNIYQAMDTIRAELVAFEIALHNFDYVLHDAMGAFTCGSIIDGNFLDLLNSCPLSRKGGGQLLSRLSCQTFGQADCSKIRILDATL